MIAKIFSSLENVIVSFEKKKIAIIFYYYSLIVLEELFEKRKDSKIASSRIYSIKHAKRSFKRAISIIKQSKLIVKLLCYAERSSPTSRATKRYLHNL